MDYEHGFITFKQHIKDHEIHQNLSALPKIMFLSSNSCFINQQDIYCKPGHHRFPSSLLPVAMETGRREQWAFWKGSVQVVGEWNC